MKNNKDITFRSLIESLNALTDSAIQPVTESFISAKADKIAEMQDFTKILINFNNIVNSDVSDVKNSNISNNTNYSRAALTEETVNGVKIDEWYIIRQKNDLLNEYSIYNRHLDETVFSNIQNYTTAVTIVNLLFESSYNTNSAEIQKIISLDSDSKHYFDEAIRYKRKLDEVKNPVYEDRLQVVKTKLESIRENLLSEMKKFL